MQATEAVIPRLHRMVCFARGCNHLPLACTFDLLEVGKVPPVKACQVVAMLAVKLLSELSAVSLLVESLAC